MDQVEATDQPRRAGSDQATLSALASRCAESFVLERVRLALWLLLGGSLAFSLGAPIVPGESRLVWVIIRIGVVLALGLGLVALRGRPSASLVGAVGEGAMLTVIAVAACTEVLVARVGAVPVIAMGVALGSAALLPLGSRAQARIAVVAALAVLADWRSSDVPTAALPALAALLTIAVSVVVAAEVRRSGELVAASLRSLQRAEMRFEQLAESTPAAFWWIGSSREIDYVSPAFARIWGAGREVVCRSWADLLATIHADDRPRILDAVRDLPLRPLDEEFRIVRADGAHRWVRTRAHIIETSDGGWAVSGMSEDVTSQRRTESALRASRERYARLVENAPDPVLTFDGEGRLLSASPAFERLLSRPVEEVRGRRLFRDEVIARGWRSTAVQIAKDLARQGAAAPRELVLVRASGDHIVVESNQRIHRGPDAGVEVEVILRDVTERRRGEEAVRLRAFAAHLQSMREDERARFAHRLHDDFAQPMSALGLHVGALLRALPPQLVEARDKAEQMQRLVARMLGAVRGVMSDLRPAVLDDFGLAVAADWEVKAFEQRTGVACATRIAVDEDRPTVGEPAVAVFRILQDALAVSQERGARHVRVDLVIRDDLIFLGVHDDGSPVSTAALPWDVVWMRERAHLYGGTVEIESPVGGGGVRLGVRVPLSPSSAAARIDAGPAESKHDLGG